MKTIILDFDQTIADTSALEPLRRSRNWASVYAAFDQMCIYPGIIDLIDQSRRHGYKVAVVTNSPRKYCELALAHLKINVDAIVGYHDTSRRKPYPDPILLALKLTGGTASHSIGLGDTAHDLAAYKAAGITSVACLWGCVNAEELTSSAPSLSIQHASELLGHF